MLLPLIFFYQCDDQTMYPVRRFESEDQNTPETIWGKWQIECSTEGNRQRTKCKAHRKFLKYLQNIGEYEFTLIQIISKLVFCFILFFYYQENNLGVVAGLTQDHSLAWCVSWKITSLEVVLSDLKWQIMRSCWGGGTVACS